MGRFKGTQSLASGCLACEKTSKEMFRQQEQLLLPLRISLVAWGHQPRAGLRHRPGAWTETERQRKQQRTARWCHLQQTGLGSPLVSLHLPHFRARSRGHSDRAQREHHRVFHGERISAARHFINPGPDSPPDSPVLGARRGLENKGGLKPLSASPLCKQLGTGCPLGQARLASG